MKKSFLIISFFISSIFATPLVIASTQQHKNQSVITYYATKDFAQLNAGDVPYYIDKGNNAIGIDARKVEYRGLFARALKSFEGPSGDYDITITAMTEEDGEPLYRLLINGVIHGTYRSSYIGPDHELDLTGESHTWRGIPLNKGDTIAIESGAHTNGEVPENGGTAWARGRWQSLSLAPAATSQKGRMKFAKHKDILVSQFDFKPDADDVHAVAALGSMLEHSDMHGVNLFAVAGTIGIQGGKYINARSLMKMAFGQENFNWTDAHKNRDVSVNLVRDRIKAVLAQGGNAWVQEAGQSNFTRDWLVALKEAGVHELVIKNNIIIVQHSAWNEKHTSPEALKYVKEKTTYQAITDGNKPMKIFARKDRRGPLTPMYIDKSDKWIASAISTENSKKHSQSLWQEAIKIIEQTDFKAHYSLIPKGGVDFSDNVELWWILELGQNAISVNAFWQRYVSDIQLDNIKPPAGRLAVVIDGNSPDPDDIGATPVMFGLLQQAGLSNRLVHLSHSCDLDPFRNRGRQINAKDEARRQKILHQLSGKSLDLFGPFNNLRNYYNCRTDQDAARDDLVDAINASSATDPLWIIEAGEPDLIGYALEKADPTLIKHVHIVSHHPANDNSGDYFEWQQILDFGVTEHQIGDQNVALQTPISDWDWAQEHENPGFRFMWDMLAYAEQDGVVPFQSNKFDCSDAGMIYWWITGADQGGNNFANVPNIKTMLLQNIVK